MHGRIDVHAHLLPGVDDGCADLLESIECGRMLVAAGYSHAFCTPHIWPNLPQNIPEVIAQRTKELQRQYDEAGVELNLLPGGELNLRPEMVSWSREQIPTYAMKGSTAFLICGRTSCRRFLAGGGASSEFAVEVDYRASGAAAGGAGGCFAGG